jgi:hypothetical protein
LSGFACGHYDTISNLIKRLASIFGCQPQFIEKCPVPGKAARPQNKVKIEDYAENQLTFASQLYQQKLADMTPSARPIPCHKF